MKITPVLNLSDEIKQYIIFVKENEKPIIPDTELNQLAEEAIQAKKFSGKKDDFLPLIKGEKITVLLGLGDQPQKINMRTIGLMTHSALQNQLFDLTKPIGVIPHEDSEPILRAIIDGAKLGTYVWDKYKSQNNNGRSFTDLDLHIQTNHHALAQQISTICDGVNLARDLANENADVAHSQYLEQIIRDIIQNDPRCKIEVLNKKELEEKGLHLHLAVNQGSNKEPKLVIVTYTGADEHQPYTALIGKGITFDTGGLNVKTGGGMVDMRLDMSGSAAVIGTLKNTVALGLKCNTYFVCGFAENAIGSRAYKPGDILISYCGKSVEVLNTDAEGRLVLADANSYIARNYQPDSIINIATLTGAVVIALGFEHTGLMSTDDTLAQELLDAATVTDDRAWRLPIYEELQEHVKSQFADIKNIGQPKCAGTISAGEFLRQFAQCDSPDQKWAHLDIAGTGTLEKDLAYFKVGATGAGVRLFTEFLRKSATPDS